MFRLVFTNKSTSKMKFNELHFCFIAFFLSIVFYSKAQFAGPVGSLNTSAIFKDSSVFVNWAKSCIVQRGLKDIAIDSLGYADLGNDTNAIGNAGNAVVSLGDGGTAVAYFNPPICNKPGPDFAVFENSFSDLFLELAFVEVSSDGINYYRFPATSNVQTQQQIGPFDLLSEPNKLNNLAGKYRALFGTPFDLEELNNISNLNVDAISYIKLIDVVGVISGPFASFDQYQQAINDPYPTPFSSSGFDLDAIGVIHQQEVGLKKIISPSEIIIYPNPTKSSIIFNTQYLDKIEEIKILTINGEYLLTSVNTKIDLSLLPSGIYIASVKFKNGILIHKKISKE
jgi:hypothetical protein